MSRTLAREPAAVDFAIPFRFEAEPGFVSIVIPVGRDAEGLQLTLTALAAVRKPAGGYEVLVGNDGADPAVSAVCRAYGVTEVPISPQAGSYVARNRALADCRGAWIAFLDADVTMEPDWLETGLAALESDDYVCGPVLIPLQQATSPGRMLDFLNAFPVEAYLRFNQFGPTANLFVRRSVIERLGGFDTRLTSGGDVEFGRRVYQSGLATQRFCPAAVVHHPPRDYLQQARKILRITRGQLDLLRLYPDRFSQFRPGPIAILRNLMPPRRLEFMARTLDEAGPQPAHWLVLFYLMAWSLKVVRAWAQIGYVLGRRRRPEGA